MKMKKRSAPIMQTAGRRRSPVAWVGRLSRISLLVAVGGMVSMALYSPASAVGDKSVVITDPVDPLQQANIQNGALKVDVGNFPATQVVSGTVDVGNLPPIQTVEDRGHPDEMHLQRAALFLFGDEHRIVHENPFLAGEKVTVTSVTAAHAGPGSVWVKLSMRWFAAASETDSCSDLFTGWAGNVDLVTLIVPAGDTVQATFPDEPLLASSSDGAWCLILHRQPLNQQQTFVTVIGHRV